MCARCVQGVHKMCARCAKDVCKMCARCEQDVCKVCTRCAQDVCKMCAKCAQYVGKMCARCAQYVCKMYAYIMFDIIEPHAFRKFCTCRVLEKSEEHWKSWRNLYMQCNSCKSIAWFCSLNWTMSESESKLWIYIGRIPPNLIFFENFVCMYVCMYVCM